MALGRNVIKTYKLSLSKNRNLIKVSLNTKTSRFIDLKGN